jgi:hypothetical protein
MHLAFWTGRDRVAIDRLFRRSGLYREKWDERRGERTYGEITMDKAIEQTSEVYTNRESTRRPLERANLLKMEPAEPSKPKTETESPDKAEVVVPEFPSTILEANYIGELALALISGTPLASQLAYASIKACLGPVVDRRVGFPGHEDIHLRHYSVNVTFRPRQGKGAMWKRVKSALADLLEERGIVIENGSRFGSGQFMVKVLAKLEKASSTGQVDVLVRFDEMRELFEKANILASTLISGFCTLFEENEIKQGSLTHGDHAVYDTHMSVIGDFTAAAFTQCFAGSGATGQGFLPRCVLTYARLQPGAGDWLPRNIENEQRIVGKMRQAIERLPADLVLIPPE